jgi:hypothetical protein
MATRAQIEANRRNAEKSCGPRSLQGKSVSKFNALKSGIYAQSQVIPGEDAAELEALAESYEDEFRPRTGPQWFLVDSMLRADWRMRRLQRIETELWEQGVQEAGGVGQAYKQDVAPERLYRRMDAAERSFFRALKEMKELTEKERQEEEEEKRELYGEPLRRLGAEPRAPEPPAPDPAAEEEPGSEVAPREQTGVALPSCGEGAESVPAAPEAPAEMAVPRSGQIGQEEAVTEKLASIAQPVKDSGGEVREAEGRTCVKDSGRITQPFAKRSE